MKGKSWCQCPEHTLMGLGRAHGWLWMYVMPGLTSAILMEELRGLIGKEALKSAKLGTITGDQWQELRRRCERQIKALEQTTSEAVSSSA